MTHDRRQDAAAQEAQVREIPRWAERYARNRTLPPLVFLVLFLAGSVGFAALGYLTVGAHMQERRLAAAIGMVAFSAFAAGWLWFSFVGAHRTMRRLTRRLYQGEGEVVAAAEPEAGRQVAPAVWFVLLFCVMATIGLGLMGLIPARYMQPVTALYVVPLLLYLYRSAPGPGGGSPLMLLWPGLYALHALVIVAGVPLHFTGAGAGLNVALPVVGYGLLAAAAGHVYSRYALRRLRAAARAPQAEEGDGS